MTLASLHLTDSYFLTFSAVLFTDRRGRAAGPAQRARDVHVRRADAQRGEPHVRHLLRKTLNDIRGQAIVFFVLVVAAAEVAVGLAIIVAIFRRRRGGATADDIDLLRG